MKILLILAALVAATVAVPVSTGVIGSSSSHSISKQTSKSKVAKRQSYTPPNPSNTAHATSQFGTSDQNFGAHSSLASQGSTFGSAGPQSFESSHYSLGQSLPGSSISQETNQQGGNFGQQAQFGSAQNVGDFPSPTYQGSSFGIAGQQSFGSPLYSMGQSEGSSISQDKNQQVQSADLNNPFPSSGISGQQAQFGSSQNVGDLPPPSYQGSSFGPAGQQSFDPAGQQSFGPAGQQSFGSPQYSMGQSEGSSISQDINQQGQSADLNNPFPSFGISGQQTQFGSSQNVGDFPPPSYQGSSFGPAGQQSFGSPQYSMGQNEGSSLSQDTNQVGQSTGPNDPYMSTGNIGQQGQYSSSPENFGALPSLSSQGSSLGAAGQQPFGSPHYSSGQNDPLSTPEQLGQQALFGNTVQNFDASSAIASQGSSLGSPGQQSIGLLYNEQGQGFSGGSTSQGNINQHSQSVGLSDPFSFQQGPGTSSFSSSSGTGNSYNSENQLPNNLMHGNIGNAFNSAGSVSGQQSPQYEQGSFGMQHEYPNMNTHSLPTEEVGSIHSSNNRLPDTQTNFNIHQNLAHGGGIHSSVFNRGQTQVEQSQTSPNIDSGFNVDIIYKYDEDDDSFEVDDMDDYLIAKSILPISGYSPKSYSFLDVSQVDFNQGRQAQYQASISIPDNDGSGEDLYYLVGVAPSAALEGGDVTRYSANIGPTVPVYGEIDDDDIQYYKLLSKGSQGAGPSLYSAQSGSMPHRVKAETTLLGNNLVVILDD